MSEALEIPEIRKGDCLVIVRADGSHETYVPLPKGRDGTVTIGRPALLTIGIGLSLDNGEWRERIVDAARKKVVEEASAAGLNVTKR